MEKFAIEFNYLGKRYTAEASKTMNDPIVFEVVHVAPNDLNLPDNFKIEIELCDIVDSPTFLADEYNSNLDEVIWEAIFNHYRSLGISVCD
jgi:hypothetical protein